MIYIIDTYALIEYFIGSKKGRKVKEIISSKNRIITPECCIAELKGWCLCEKLDFDKVYQIVRKNTEIEPIFTEDWLQSAEIRYKMRKENQSFGLVDAIIVSKQKKYNARIVSGDIHFKNIKNTVYLK